MVYQSRSLVVLLTCALIFVVTFTGKATSATLSYDESVSGDISPFRPNDPLFVFDIGLNTITGSASRSPSGSSDFDNFGFIVPQASVLTSITYEFWNVVTEVSGLGTQYGFYEGSVINSVFAQIVGPEFDTSPVSLSVASLPFTSGTYNTNQAFTFTSGAGAGSWDYTLTFEVQAVPIPATAWLFTSGLFALIGISRRKNR